MMMRFSFAQNIKEPNVSGQFYDADPEVLTKDVASYIAGASVSPQENVPMIIAPHAGYVYSGGVAGYSFKTVSEQKPKTIIVLAPSHFYPFDGVSVWSQGGMKTPLGVVPVDEEFTKALLAADPKFIDDPKAFDREHGLEVEIPFLQETYQDFKIVPVILGQMSFPLCEKLAQTLNTLIGDRKDVLIVVSSDMSHYHDGDTARAMDLGTLEIIKKLDAKDLYRQCLLRKHEMCGFIPVTTALLLAQARGWEAEVLKYSHSGEVIGDNRRVVGYGAVAFHSTEQKGTGALNQEQKRVLLDLARKAIKEFVTQKKTIDIKIADQRLAAAEGVFVSLYKDENLRGCIGHIVSNEPLQKTVRDMAIAAATNDPRFSPVTAEELKDLELEISVLSRPWRVRDAAEIEMGKHGVIIAQGLNRGVFLPQVATETGWSKEKFLSELCAQKAGLTADCWKDSKTEIAIFTADVFK